MRVNLFKTLLGAFLPNGLLEMTEIGAAAKLAYGRLLQYAGERGYCWPSYQTLARAIGMSRTTAIRAVNELVEEKLIEVEQRISPDGDNTSNTFFFLDHPVLYLQSSEGSEVGGVKLIPPSSITTPGGGVKLRPKKIHIQKRINEAAVESMPTVVISRSPQAPPLALEVEEAIQALPPELQLDAKEIAISEARPPGVISSNYRRIARRVVRRNENGALVFPTSGLLRAAIREDYAATERKHEAAEAEERAFRVTRKRAQAERELKIKKEEDDAFEHRRKEALTAYQEFAPEIQRKLQAEARHMVGCDLGPAVAWTLVYVIEKHQNNAA
jgi:hypothetical protein